MPSAEIFFAAFVGSYEENRERYTDIEWNEIWENTNSFSLFMIYNHDSVIRQIANCLNLVCPPGEPMHIDAVFTTTERWDWFPIAVAIEHENDYRGFQREINKLISIKCNLKVGITYSIIENEQDDMPNRLDIAKDKIEQSFKTSFGLIGDNLKKCDESYLFIIGCETSPKKIDWHYTIINQNTKPGFAVIGHIEDLRGNVMR